MNEHKLEQLLEYFFEDREENEEFLKNKKELLEVSLPLGLWKRLGFSEIDVSRLHTVGQWLRNLQHVCAAGVVVSIKLDPLYCWLYLIPFTIKLIRIAQNSSQRLIVGFTGGAGTGKTVLTEILTSLMNTLMGDPFCCRFSMDGYHFPNSYLESNYIEKNGQMVKLRNIKGAFCTMDIQSFLRDLKQVTDLSVDVKLPVYDRKIHDPVPGAIFIPAEQCKCVIVEGLYLLNTEDHFIYIKDYLHLSVMVIADVELCKKRVVERKVMGGSKKEDAMEYFDRVDRVNHQIISQNVDRADAVLVLTGENNLISDITSKSSLL